MIKNANDRPTYMTDLEKCLRKLEFEGYTDQYKIKHDKLYCINSQLEFAPENVKAVNFYRFEGISNPDDMAILYAIETNDGRKGTLVDAYGVYADGEMGDFMQHVEIHKRVHEVTIY